MLTYGQARAIQILVAHKLKLKDSNFVLASKNYLYKNKPISNFLMGHFDQEGLDCKNLVIDNNLIAEAEKEIDIILKDLK